MPDNNVAINGGSLNKHVLKLSTKT